MKRKNVEMFAESKSLRVIVMRSSFQEIHAEMNKDNSKVMWL